MNLKKEVSDEQNERHKRILALILKQEGNKHCADCRTRNPTWASVNLGVFVCLTCSGIHRSLGVHISQVRSCNLDTWLPRQVEFVKNMGNAKANSFWEAQLPDHFRRPPGGNPNPELASFIRAKYMEKRYAAADADPPTIDNYTTHPYVVSSAADQSANGSAAPAHAPQAATVAAPAQPQADLLGFVAPTAPTAAVTTTADPFDLLAGGSGAGNGVATAVQAAHGGHDDWSDFASAAPSAPPTSAPTPVAAAAAGTVKASAAPTAPPAAAQQGTDPFATLAGQDLIASIQSASISVAPAGAATAAPVTAGRLPPPPAVAKRTPAKSAEDILKLYDAPGAHGRTSDPFGSPHRMPHMAPPHMGGFSSSPNLMASRQTGAPLHAPQFAVQPGSPHRQQQHQMPYIMPQPGSPHGQQQMPYNMPQGHMGAGMLQPGLQPGLGLSALGPQLPNMAMAAQPTGQFNAGKF
eukprot:jgi/Chrzof1/13939/Cz08g18170.t1